jgi:tetratricopeptide (TPR) repeat protein
MNKLLYFVFAFFFSTSFFAQKDGFWDKERATTKEIKLSAGKRILIKAEDLPVGTTEFVYRITVLDENQKLTSSLVSVLKAIPDPTGISQGTAGAIHLTSAISGDDKCTYALFQEANAANLFLKEGTTDRACWEQKEKVNKDAKLISSSSLCLTNLPNLWFGFESQNWVMNQKIVLEVVPWVDYKASRGWDKTAKNEVVTIGKKLEWYKVSPNKELFLAQFIESFTEKYKYSEFKQLLSIEKNKTILEIQEIAIKKTNQFDFYLDKIRAESILLNRNGKVEEAVLKIQNEIIAKKYAKDVDYGLLGDIYLFSKQYAKAEESIEKAIKMNPSELRYHLILAHVYLFTDRVSEAKDIHKMYKDQNISSKETWIKQTNYDFVEFGLKGFPTDNFKKISRILE